MKGSHRVSGARGVALVNLQKRYVVPTASLWPFVRNLKRCLRLGNSHFNVCFVDEDAIRHMNLAYRGKDKATDVLSFPWTDTAGTAAIGTAPASSPREPAGRSDFLGEVAISVPTARRNASEEGHSTLQEIRWLILHGVLHLLGYDHEHDKGEMTALELDLREQLGVAGSAGRAKAKGQAKKSKG
jgi:probable rRNA maturation factor